tara:strand:+ start:98 stop:283 length:186 start_codon:yes stop_codon:yes gene_type:complete
MDLYNEGMKKILVISLYNGANEIVEMDEELKQELEQIRTDGGLAEHHKNVWISEEVMYVEL